MPAWTGHEDARFRSCARCGDSPTLYKWMVERPARFYIAVRTACIRRRVRSSAPRELLRRQTILAGEEPTDEGDPVHEEQPEPRTQHPAVKASKRWRRSQDRYRSTAGSSGRGRVGRVRCTGSRARPKRTSGLRTHLRSTASRDWPPRAGRLPNRCSGAACRPSS